MKSTNIPPKKTKNNTYENQKVFVIVPVIKQIKNVWIKSIIPIANGCFICIKIKLIIILQIIEINCIISGNILIKILILEINDKEISFFLKF